MKNDDEDGDDADGVVKTQGNKRRKVEEGVHFRVGEGLKGGGGMGGEGRCIRDGLWVRGDE